MIVVIVTVMTVLIVRLVVTVMMLVVTMMMIVISVMTVITDYDYEGGGMVPTCEENSFCVWLTVLVSG